MSTQIESLWLADTFICQTSRAQISVVAYGHPAGIPARFCAGLIAPINLAKQLIGLGIETTLRLIDPSPIANYCNAWGDYQSPFRRIMTDFIGATAPEINYYFDRVQDVTAKSLEILGNVGIELETSSVEAIVNMVRKIRESGRRHGGEAGEKNSVLYMAAHPFSWLNLYHPSLWRTTLAEDISFINLMSKPERRFTLVRDYLKEKREDLSSGICPIDCYMTICNTPCYIPLEGEPTYDDLITHGYQWCLERYESIKKLGDNYPRVLKDFRELNKFLEAACPV